MAAVSYVEALGVELHPSGRDRFRVLRQAHDDHRPSLEVSDRFGLKCRSCGVWVGHRLTFRPSDIEAYLERRSP